MTPPCKDCICLAICKHKDMASLFSECKLVSLFVFPDQRPVQVYADVARYLNDKRAAENYAFFINKTMILADIFGEHAPLGIFLKEEEMI